MSHAIRGLGPHFFRITLLGLLVAVLFWQWSMLLAQPAHYVPTRIEISLIPGEARVMGGEALAAPAADERHVRLRRAVDGGWWIGNASNSREVELSRAGQASLLRSLPLASGMTVGIHGQALRIEEASRERLTLLTPQGKRIVYDGGDIQAVHRIACPEQSVAQAARQFWNRWVPRALMRKADLELGGLIDCGNRVALSGVARGSARIFQDASGRFLLRAGRAGDATHAICTHLVDGVCARVGSLSEQEAPLAGVDSLVVGRTGFDASLEADKLVLLPRKRVAVFESSVPATSNGVVWLMEHDDPWRWPSQRSPLLLASLVLLLTALLAAWSQWRAPGSALRLAMVPAASVSLAMLGALAYWQGTALGAGWSLALISTVSVLAMFAPVRGLSLLSLGLSVVLGCIGLMTLQFLGHGGADSDGLRYFQSNAAILSMGLALLFGFAYRSGAHWCGMEHLLEPALFSVSLLALLGLLLQYVFGGEAGVFGFQPVELAKLVLVLLAAHMLALRMDWRQTRNRIKGLKLWLIFLAPVAAFVLVTVVSLVMVHDISPLVLLATWSLAILFAWVIASGHAWTGLLLAVMLAGGITGALWGVANGGGDFLQRLPYTDRIAVWLSPELHPHSGEQLGRATRLIQQGGETGMASAQAWHVPAIQDDFAPAWFLARFGAAGGAGLVMLQTLYLATLLALGWRALQTDAGDFRTIWLGRLRFFALWGGAGLLLGHFTISWGTNLSWLPVMGQPAPYLSYGGSMLLFFLIPLQALALEPDRTARISPSPRNHDL